MAASDLKVGDVCTLKIDWGDKSLLRGKRVQIIRIQMNGRQKFAKVLWKSREAVALKEEFGEIFSLDELQKIT